MTSSLQSFPPCVLKWRNVRFENLDNILPDWAEDKVQKTFCETFEQVREGGRRKMMTHSAVASYITDVLTAF